MTQPTKLFTKGFKYPIYPTTEQIELLNKTFGCCRYVYNKALTESIAEHKNYLANKNSIAKPSVSAYTFVNKLPAYKSEYPWLSEVSSVALQQSMLHLGASYTSFFKKLKGYPSFKKKCNKQSFSLMPNSFKVTDNQLYIAKFKKPLAIGWSRELPSYPSSATISKTPTGKYYISFLCEYSPVKTTGMEVTGLDMGIKDFLTKSDGTKIANPKHLNKYQKRLRRAQQSLSRKNKGSSNRSKARIQVARVYESITNSRNNFQHQLSRQLVNDNQVIGIETLKVANMVKNHKLARSISDVSWTSFFNKLIYKAQESQQCTIVRMDTYYPSSHICSKTKEKLDRKLSLKERTWDCPYCGKTHDRDINAAINIKDRAIQVVRDITKANGKQPYGMLLLA